ncbi:MAG: outer membrane lipoprotein carrier protein LolA [Alphaproteobacteria bacterium]|nr:outer membrane lipoprotein carrier protein LolA [Alphaproteobacteria bacterium]
MKRIIYSLLALTLFLTGAMATQGAEKYEQYLNSIKTLSGDFSQTNSRGQSAQGKIQISRPGRMRLSYAPPSSLLIVADGTWLVTKDIQADEVNYVSLENTPAAFILRPHVQFSGDVIITSIVPKDNNTTEISLIRAEDPEAGYITLIFQDNPISLKGWRVTDAQGETRVVLSNVQPNVHLPQGLFQIERPNLIQRIF